MATIVQTNGATQVLGPANLTRTVMTASDTLTYFSGANQVLFLRNPTAADITINLVGTAPSSVDPGSIGGPVSTAGGKSLTVTLGTALLVNLDNIGAYLDGTGVVTVTNGTGLIATLMT